jgi:hypothetical protein
LKGSIKTHTFGLTAPILVGPPVRIQGGADELGIDISALPLIAPNCAMADRGQITGATLDGLLTLDNAIDLDATAIRQIVSPAASPPALRAVAGPAVAAQHPTIGYANKNRFRAWDQKRALLEGMPHSPRHNVRPRDNLHALPLSPPWQDRGLLLACDGTATGTDIATIHSSQLQLRDPTGTAFAGGARLRVEAKQRAPRQRDVDPFDGTVERGRIHANDAEYPTGMIRAHAQRLERESHPKTATRIEGRVYPGRGGSSAAATASSIVRTHGITPTNRDPNRRASGAQPPRACMTPDVMMSYVFGGVPLNGR